MAKYYNYYTTDAAEKIGVLVVNLGTPEKPDTKSVRRYLSEFLSDERVVEIPKLAWQVILQGIILRVRPAKSAKAYQEIWEDDGSPLLLNTAAITKALQTKFKDEGHFFVDYAMRYGSPSIPEKLRAFAMAGCSKLLVLPLYPQFSATTTATTFDAIAKELKKWRRTPELRFINEYHDNRHYIDAVVDSIKATWEKRGKKYHLLMSFHGLPQRNVELGDPYQQQCQVTAKAIAAKLGLVEGEWSLTFQSRFGPATWLQPYTDTVLEQLPGQDKKFVDVICPGFPADCLETLEEIAMQSKEVFLTAGGKEFNYIKSLNNGEKHVECLASLIFQHTAGWYNDGTSS